MSVAAHHNDWLSLVEVSGPFLALPVLVDALPGGLDKADRALTVDLWQAHAEWLDEDRGGAADPAVHRAWARYVVERVLGYESDVLVDDTDALGAWSVEVPEHETSLHATLAVRDPGATDDPPLLLIDVIPPDTAVLESSSGTGWSASPAERMEALLKATDVQLGLVTNGEQWTLVHVSEGENTGFATWYASLWREEPLTLRAFTTLLGMRRFFAVAEHETLQALLDRSREDQQGVTTQLGKQVRRAIQILIQQIDRVDHDRDGRLLEGMTEQRLYEAAVTVMMRLIFLFYAEENDLLLLGDEFYDETYAASTLREQLQATADENGEEILERFHDAWPRLLSTFRAVYAGVEHEQMRLPAYGGALFDPDRYPFLEGREPETSWEADPANPLPIDNRTVLHLLNAIQTLEVKIPGGGRENRPLSFRALDVEQIGHVYETLLDHAAKRAGDWVFGLEGTKDKEPEVPLRELEGRVDDTEELVTYLKDETGRSVGALKKRVAAEEKAVYERWGHRWKPAFGGDEESAAVAAKWGLLVREDSTASPVVVPPGHVYVTESEQRRSSGTHYTPKSLTEEIVTHTLEPLVYEGPAEGRDRSDWQRRTPEQILDLKVCDPACGSGAFLVQACRYLAESLVEAWEEHSSTEGPDGHALPIDSGERLIGARRYVADRCLYGVDINPLATEMAKLSLWLITLQRNRPFTFLDHAIRTGDSLLGIVATTDLTDVSENGSNGSDSLFSHAFFEAVSHSLTVRSEIRRSDARDARHWRAKRTALESLEAGQGGVFAAADVIMESLIAGRDVDASQLWKLVSEDSHARRPTPNGEAYFHWPLEFPEATQQGGFDAVVANPPFLGGKQISGGLGADYGPALKKVFDRSRGAADLVAYFFRQFGRVVRPGGMIGALATTSISETASRKVGIEPILNDGGTLVRVVSAGAWPGEASVEIAKIILCMGEWKSLRYLDGEPVSKISGSFDDEVDVGIAKRLRHQIKYSQGTTIYGDSFVLNPGECEAWLEACPRLKNYLRVFVSGDVLNGTPDADDGRRVVDFGERDKGEIQGCDEIVTHLEVAVGRERANQTTQIHEHRPWLHWDKRTARYREAREFDRIIACVIVSSYPAFVFVDPQKLLTHGLKFFVDDRATTLVVLQSAIHEEWARATSSTFGSTLRYSTRAAFDTFPLSDSLLQDPEFGGIAERCVSSRQAIMEDVGWGPRDFLREYHSSSTKLDSMRAFRELSLEAENRIARVLGIGPIDLRFQDLRRGERLTLPPGTRQRVLSGLLDLNIAMAREAGS